MFYDGGCPLCSREVAHYKRIDKQHRVDWADIHQYPARLQTIGIDQETAMRRLHVLDRNGQVVIGAYAFKTIWQELPYYHLLAKLISPSIIMRVADKAYIWFADYRYTKRVQCGNHCMQKTKS